MSQPRPHGRAAGNGNGHSHGNGNGNGTPERSRLYIIGCKISAWVSDFSAHPLTQVGFIVICLAWFASGLSTNLLTAALSIMAITLTQMVLNRQNEREAEARRRDIAMHAKLDELVVAMHGARNKMAGIEELPEEEIAELKDELKQATDDAQKAEGRTPR